jgi:co-chaperonin GroES (HSP10)
MEKEFEIQIPKSTIKPMNGRIFCIDKLVDVKTKGGLILPTSIKGWQGQDQVDIEYRRYFVVEVSEDITIAQLHVEEEKNGKKVKRKLMPGDEVSPFFPPDMVNFKFAEVIDWNNAKKYIMFHYTEIASTSRKIPQKIE